MAVERTLSIIKPDATARNQTGAVNALIEKAGLRIIAQKRVRWTPGPGREVLRGAQGAAVLRRSRPLHDLGPDRGAGAGGRERGQDLPRRDGRHRPGQGRHAGTIRKELAESIERNSVHGSDSAENAEIEIALNFKPDEIVG